MHIMKMPPANSRSARLRALRKARGLSQMELAVIAGFHRAHISKAEMNKETGGLAFWQTMATSLGVSVGELLEGEAAPAAGLSEAPGFLDDAPRFDPAAEIGQFGQVAAEIETMLKAERMPHDTRTVAELAAVTWREVTNLSRALPFAERLEIVLSARRSALRQARSAMFLSGDVKPAG